jgi:hypothetical protein
MVVRFQPDELPPFARQEYSCEIWGFHGSDYEECRLLGYKNPVRTSQDTHYVYATEPSRLMLCNIWGFHGGNYEKCRLLDRDVAWLLQEPHDFLTQSNTPMSVLFMWVTYFQQNYQFHGK